MLGKEKQQRCLDVLNVFFAGEKSRDCVTFLIAVIEQEIRNTSDNVERSLAMCAELFWQKSVQFEEFEDKDV